MATSAKNFLQTTIVKDIATDKTGIISVRSDESVPVGVEKLIANSITSVPVF